eukprot:gene17105-18826_t
MEILKTNQLLAKAIRVLYEPSPVEKSKPVESLTADQLFGDKKPTKISGPAKKRRRSNTGKAKHNPSEALSDEDESDHASEHISLSEMDLIFFTSSDEDGESDLDDDCFP